MMEKVRKVDGAIELTELPCCNPSYCPLLKNVMIILIDVDKNDILTYM